MIPPAGSLILIFFLNCKFTGHCILLAVCVCQCVHAIIAAVGLCLHHTVVEATQKERIARKMHLRRLSALPIARWAPPFKRRGLSGGANAASGEEAVQAERVKRMKAQHIQQAKIMAAKVQAAAATTATATSGARKSGSGALPIKLAAAGLGLGLGLAYIWYDIRQNPEGYLGKLYARQRETVDSVYLPTSEELLPKYESGPHYGQVPPGAPAPPLLVLDMERTIIGSEYDAKFGWRHVKRPGLQKFIDRMSQYYEIVIFSENELNEDILQAIDPEHKCHKHGPSAMEVRNGQMIKRLDLMNRDLARIVLLDDSEAASCMFPRNTLLVKPFEDVHDARDSELEDLMLLLQALVHDGVEDVRDTLDSLGTHEASEAVVEYKIRLAAVKEREQKKRERGLGGILKAATGVKGKADKGDGDEAEGRSVLSRIVGASPDDAVGGSSNSSTSAQNSVLHNEVLKDVKGLVKPSEVGKMKKKGALFQWFEEGEAEKARLEELKIQRMNDIQLRRMKEKADKDEELRRKQQYE